jgi:hypothetical protein
VWPIAGVAITGAAISATYYVNSRRDYTYCFACK